MPRPGRNRSGLKIALSLGVIVCGVVAIAIWPGRASEFAGWIASSVRDRLSASSDEAASDEVGGPASTVARVFRPSPAQRSALDIAPVKAMTFRPEGMAEGRIALNDDDNVPVTSPYAGRVTKVLVRAGDEVKAGDILLTMEATDMVQAQSDYQGALNTIAKTTALLKLDQIIAVRQQELFQAKAVALKDYQSAQNDVIGAQSDLKTAEASLEAVKNRLRILGKSDVEIAAFEKNGKMSAETQIRAPIAGTIVQRKVGIGQYLSTSADPVFVIGDLSTVWLVANVRESEIPKIRIGQEVEARVVGIGTRVFKAKVDYMAASLDPATRRLSVRSEVENPDRVLKPEMFAAFTIFTGPGETAPAISPAAIVYEGRRAHVWVARPDGTIEARNVTLGLVGQGMVQVVEGLSVGEEIVTRGAIFMDRAASGEKAS
ncbi:efflux RND transporter periplasmic adaptor subunit [Methylobacterium sp. BTF04]|uniref:efflux RND transporter periplasmic adaptor subunit n=1 Tax=Methylobacterium sp. BTF04 TaxID=2708300 RepID=UPI0013D8CDDB|nr:efflux RND transporter periplasmic adaptor subunit [Methylobacterium sp. BTF04]NEU13224.1 efflux RND transporter periplasmic adaptor subunit [Methylobacterium sp. BTF04]